MSSQKDGEEDQEYYEEDPAADNQYVKDDKMQRRKIKKRQRGNGGQRQHQKGDYESPYAEYLLGAIKEGDGSQKKGEIQQR